MKLTRRQMALGIGIAVIAVPLPEDYAAAAARGSRFDAAWAEVQAWVGKAFPGAVVAVDTVMRAAARADAPAVRSLRAGTELDPTGKREGLFLEVKDNFGTLGWVSVEDLK